MVVVKKINNTIQVASYIPVEDYDWLESHSTNKSDLIRKLIREYINNQKLN